MLFSFDVDRVFCNVTKPTLMVEAPPGGDTTKRSTFRLQAPWYISNDSTITARIEYSSIEMNPVEFNRVYQADSKVLGFFSFKAFLERTVRN